MKPVFAGIEACGAGWVVLAVVACLTAATWMQEATIPRVGAPRDSEGLSMRMIFPTMGVLRP